MTYVLENEFEPASAMISVIQGLCGFDLSALVAFSLNVFRAQIFQTGKGWEVKSI